MENLFDVIKCQELYVSGANKIDDSGSLIDVTESVRAMTEGPAQFSIAIAASTTNAITITITCQDVDGNTLTGVRNLEFIVSDDSTGAGLASTLAPDSITASTGAVLTALTANLHLMVQTAASGIAVLKLTDAAQGAGFVAVTKPLTGALTVGEIVTGDYTD